MKHHLSPHPVAPIDYPLCWVVGLLLAFGVVMVYSSSVALWEAERNLKSNYTPMYFMLRHVMLLAFSGVVAWFAFHISPQGWRFIAKGLGVVVLLLLLLVLIPGVGIKVGGARRWLPLFITQFQPSELAKWAMVLYAADYSVRKQEWDKIYAAPEFKAFWAIVWPMLAILAIGGLCLLFEPDMGAFLLISIIAIGVLFFGGLNARIFAYIVIVLLLVFVVIIAFSKFRRDRIFAFLNPWGEGNSSNSATYQLTAALIAMALGGWWGKGLGTSIQKLNWLPEAHTDFILAIIGEELGWVTVSIVIGTFFWLTQRIMVIGRAAIQRDDMFPGLLAFGVALWIGCQAFVHIGVNMGALPTKGLTLPLISYGGTALCMNLVALAAVLRIDYENRRRLRGG